MQAVRSHFHALFDALSATLDASEHLYACLYAEESDFIRLNNNQMRQAGHVDQYEIQLALVRADRQCLGQYELSNNLAIDVAEGQALIRRLRQWLPDCPADPYLYYNNSTEQSTDIQPDLLTDSNTVLSAITSHAQGLDLVGIYAAGQIAQGFASSHGQRNWHQRALFNLDCSLHHNTRAVKMHYAGNRWSTETFEQQLQRSRTTLELMIRPAVTLDPGRYRTYLAPTAVAELMHLLGWDGFSLGAQKTQQSPLQKLVAGERQLHEQITLTEDHAGAFAARFSDEGFSLPARVELVRAGRAAGALCNARSAREFNQPVNAGSETPQSLSLAAGNLATTDIMDALDDGLYINHLWYGNYSDHNECRMTGLTRYACFQVKAGKCRAPIEVMRFDDSIYRLLGEQLLAITQDRQLLHDPDTYEHRSLASMHLPGILLNEFRLTL